MEMMGTQVPRVGGLPQSRPCVSPNKVGILCKSVYCLFLTIFELENAKKKKILRRDLWQSNNHLKLKQFSFSPTNQSKRFILCFAIRFFVL